MILTAWMVGTQNSEYFSTNGSHNSLQSQHTYIIPGTLANASHVLSHLILKKSYKVGTDIKISPIL